MANTRKTEAILSTQCDYERVPDLVDFLMAAKKAGRYWEDISLKERSAVKNQEYGASKDKPSGLHHVVGIQDWYPAGDEPQHPTHNQNKRTP